MSPIVKRLILLGIVAVVAVAAIVEVAGSQRGLPPVNPAVVTPVPTTRADAPQPQPSPQAPQVPPRVAQLEQRLAENPRDVAVMSELSTYYFENKRYAQAADIVFQATEVEPKNARLRQALAQALFYQGMTTMAQRELKRAIDLDPNDAEAHFNYALIISHGPGSDMEAAKASWEAVVRIDGDGELGRRAKEFLTQPIQSRQ